jgi:hypothetical protein
MRRLIGGLIDLLYPRALGEPDRESIGANVIVVLLLVLGAVGLYLSSRLPS